tara:strand:- start:1085 stop:1921 length:837 start_codon:yes stop_codon:yes gene_type:complete
MRNINPNKIEKNIIKNLIKNSKINGGFMGNIVKGGNVSNQYCPSKIANTDKKSDTSGFCGKYNNDACNKIEIRIDPIAPLGSLLNDILNLIQNGPINTFIKGINFVINQWNENIYKVSTILEQIIVLVLFTINGYTNVINYLFDDVRLILKTLIIIITSGPPHTLISLLLTPIVSEFINFILDTATLDVVTSMFILDFAPALNLIRATFNLFLGKTIKSRCNLEDYGNNKKRMNKECHEFFVPKCKLNIRTIFYISFTLLIIIYISCWLSFFKIFYQD